MIYISVTPFKQSDYTYICKGYLYVNNKSQLGKWKMRRGRDNKGSNVKHTTLDNKTTIPGQVQGKNLVKNRDIIDLVYYTLFSIILLLCFIIYK